MSWKDVLKEEPKGYGRLIREENKRIIGQAEEAHKVFNASQKMLRNGAVFIVKIHPLINVLPLAAMFPIIRGTGIGPSIKNSVFSIADAMVRLADHRDAKREGFTRQMLIDTMNKIKAAQEKLQ